MSTIFDWSTTAANNATADTSINWAEGQAPSTVNNSARVMMARVKELLNDLGGVAIATGTANAVTLAASSGFVAYADGLRVSFRAASTNSGAATLNVNSIGAKSIVKFTLNGETSLSGNEIQEDAIYELVYSTILNGAAGAWLLLNPTNIDVIPPGFGGPYFGASAPTGWLICNGATVSRTTYARLFTAIGTIWGAGDGTTTFKIPDGRDDYIRGASGTLPVGTRQTDSIKGHVHTGTTESSGAHTHTYSRATTGDERGGGSSDDISFVNSATSSSGAHTHPFTTDSTGGTETRPRGIVANWIIKT